MSIDTTSLRVAVNDMLVHVETMQKVIAEQQAELATLKAELRRESRRRLFGRYW